MVQDFVLHVSTENVDACLASNPLLHHTILNLTIVDTPHSKSTHKLFELLTKFADCVETVTFKCVHFDDACFAKLHLLKKLTSISFVECTSLLGLTRFQILTLSEISFEKSDEIMCRFAKQMESDNSLDNPKILLPGKICVRNDDYTWNGFEHESLTSMLLKSQEPKHLMLIGPGTGSYFDSDDFTFKLHTLDTTMITLHWYVGITTSRTAFLKSQLGHLKTLIIHQLPFDFDGGKVLKYICDEMKLETFKYRDVLLINNSTKQSLADIPIEFNEIQITSAYEIVRQFPGMCGYIICI
jgi:hypothetical protein